jgi:4-hydroxybutyrate CoA-transferase
MSWKEAYKKKLVSVEDAAAVIKSNDRIWYSPVCSAPVDVINAICKRKDELKNVSMFSALILYPFDYFKAEYKGRISHTSLFLGPIERKMFDQGNIEVLSYQFAHSDWVTKNIIKPTVFIMDAAPPDENGNFSFGPVGVFNGHTAAQCAGTIIVQVNNEAPFVYGSKEAFINIEDVDYICEQDHKIAELPKIPITDMEKTIANKIVSFIEDGSTFQIGVGGLSNAIGFFLEHHKDLGIHTEMLVDSMVTLVEKGIVTGNKKTLYPGEITCSFGIGARKLYDFMHKNKSLKAYPISYIADENVIAKNSQFVAINNALMCDLSGQVCAESIGFSQFSCTGGQVNFVRGARMSPGGKSFLVLESTAKKADGAMISKIVTAFPPGAVVTTPRSDVDYIVTEYGAAHLRGKTIPARVKEMISIAHPDFKEQLMKEAKENKLLID